RRGIGEQEREHDREQHERDEQDAPHHAQPAPGERIGGDGEGGRRCHGTLLRSCLDHCARTAAWPNSPFGRTNRTTTRTAKNIVLAQIGDHSTAVTSSMTSAATAATSAPPMLPSPPSTTMTSSREIRS